MPRSSKAPEPPPEPDINEIIQNDVARIKRLLGLDVNRLALGSEVEGIVAGAGSFGSTDYTVTGVNVIEFVNVSTSFGPSQGGTPPPPQVTGLTTNVISNTQINLAWTAYGGSDFNFYTVYRGTVSGFAADSSSDIATPTTNSYNNTGLTAGTTYYYRVATTNDALLEGPLSAEVSGITTGDTTPPGQVTGLTATVISDTQINLGWTASGAGDLNHYDVHRSTTTGFTPAVGNRIFQPTTNSYNNTGLTASTTYYYKVAAVDNASNIGTYSTQATGTTTAASAGNPANLWLKFDGNYTDSSAGGGNTVTSFNSSGFVGSGMFGGNSVKINSPTVGTDHVEVTSNTNINIDMAGKWSFSCWVYAETSSGDFFSKFQSTNNYTDAQFHASDIRFNVTKAGTDFGKRTGIGGAVSLNAWHHVVGTWDGTTNTINLYIDKVSQVSTFSAGDTVDNSNLMIGGLVIGGNRFNEFGGRIDEFQLFKGIVLTQTQVDNLFATNAP
jgi:hypothetical protein